MLPREKGRIVVWDEGRGYGWLRWGQEKVFFHIKEFGRGDVRLAVGDEVEFERGVDMKGRACAKALRSCGLRPDRKNSRPKRRSKKAGVGSLMELVILLVLPGLGMRKLPWEWWIGVGVMVAMSGIAFWMYAHDKRRAEEKGWWLAESSLHLVGVLGGWPGAFWAQWCLRHKSSKRSFQFVFWCVVFLCPVVAVDVLVEQRLSEWIREFWVKG
ncbi:MAG: DUF1294 domain-containing protein [Verrucomicrobiales bacterium]|nr:DUF1294 domain-containing protein [Verrucomicrobiales bacterium]